jgi:hypothetical protein
VRRRSRAPSLARPAPIPMRAAGADSLRRVPSTQRFTSSDGVQIALHECGEHGREPPVVLRHGFAAHDPRFAMSIVELLA